MPGVEGMMGDIFTSKLYLNIPHLHQADLPYASVLFIPTPDIITHLIHIGKAAPDKLNLPTEKFCRAEIVEFSSLTSQAPIVLAFFSPTAPKKIAVEEMLPLKTSTPVIERTIEFAPEYYQVGSAMTAPVAVPSAR